MNINLKINGQPVSVAPSSTILEAAEKLEIKIPTLCHFKMDCFHVDHRSASCRICVVEVKGRPNLAPACSTPAAEGMEVHTNTLRAINARRTILDLLLSDHPKDCLICPKNLNCQLQALAQEMGLHHLLYKGEQSTYNKDLSSQAIARDLDQVHHVPPLRNRLQRDPDRRRALRRRARLQRGGRPGRAETACRNRMRVLRPVRAGVPGGGAQRNRL